MPVVIMLGDFLQLRPAANASLLDDLRLMQGLRDTAIPAEHQAAQRLFLETPACYQLNVSNRFREDPAMQELMTFMRSPGDVLPDSVNKSWESIQDGNRAQQSVFQTGRMLGIYWETVARWASTRAERDADTLQTPLYLIQAADRIDPPILPETYAKLMNHYNPFETGGMHGLSAVHVGMRMRLLEALDKKN